VADKLKALGVRVTVDDRSEKVNLKILQAQQQKIPYMLVVGGREAEAGKVAVRHRKKGDLGPVPLEDFVKTVIGDITSKSAE
jgi:threonyl-tRNA synthetase